MRVQSTVRRGATGAAVAGAAAVAYMLFESQWIDCREQDLRVPGLPAGLSGLRILHLSDIHAAQPGLNLVALARAVRWAQDLQPDLVILTGDIIDGGRGSSSCLRLLSQLRPRLGMFGVTGNHEYGLSKNPLKGPRSDRSRCAGDAITWLRDECALLRVDADAVVALCGADYITRGYGLLNGSAPIPPGAFPILITHRPPADDDPLTERFPVVFAGHTHGGQIRLPTPWGMVALHREALPHTEGVHVRGGNVLVISRGVGCTFLPFRLFCRPEACLFRLSAREGGEL